MDCFVEVKPEALEQLKKDLGEKQAEGKVVRIVFEGFG